MSAKAAHHAALAERFTVIAPDIVGFGCTDRPDAFPYGLDARAPQRVDRLVLMAPVARASR